MNKKWIFLGILVFGTFNVCARGFTDPTRPPWLGPRQTGAQNAGLQAILSGGPRRLALIDGRLCTVGERVGASRIMAIRSDAVVLRGRLGERTLFLPNHSIKIVKTAVLGGVRP